MKAVLTILLMIVSCYGYDSQQLYDQLCKESINGFFPHPEDCHKFIRCSHGKAYVFYCPANLLWHQEIESCDYSYRTKCKFHEVKNEDHKSTVEYLQSFIEHKSKPKFYYVKSMINNYNRTVLTEETLAVNVTEAIITDFDKTSIEINENLNSSINLKENILKKRLTKATKCNKNNNRTIITKRTVAVKTTEPTLTDFSKNSAEITENINNSLNLISKLTGKVNKVNTTKNCINTVNNTTNSTVNFNSNMLKKLTATDHVINTTETLLKSFQKAVTKMSVNNVTPLNLTEIETVKLTEVMQTTEYAVNLTENSTKNNMTMLKKLKSPKKCTCLKKSKLKLLTEDSAGITESSVKTFKTTERLREKTTEREHENVIETEENPLKSTAESSVNISQFTDSVLDKITEEENEKVKENLESPLMANENKDGTLTENTTYTVTTEHHQALSTKPSILTDMAANPITDLERKTTTLTAFYKTTEMFSNSSHSSENILPLQENIVENTDETVAAVNISLTEFKFTAVLKNLTDYRENTFNLTENLKHPNNIVTLNDSYLTDMFSVKLTAQPNVNFTVNEENSVNTLNLTENIKQHNNSGFLTDSYLMDNTSVNTTVKPNVNLTVNAENSANTFNLTENVKEINNSHILTDYNLTDTIYVTVTDKLDVILTVNTDNAVKLNVNLTVNGENPANTLNSTKNPHNINNSDILTDSHLKDNFYNNITVQPNVNLTVKAENLANSFNSTQNPLNINKSEILTDSLLTDNFSVNTVVKPNVNLTVNAENPVNTFNSTEHFIAINISDISIDFYATENFPVELTVKPNVNLTVNTENPANTLNSTAVNSMITESAKNISYFFSLTENFTEVIGNTVNLTEKVKEHNDSTVNPFEYPVTKEISRYLSEKSTTKISTELTTENNDSANLTVITANTTEANYPSDSSTDFLTTSTTKNPIHFSDLTENSTEPLNISIIREFTVNLTEEITVPTKFPYSLTEISLRNVTNENLTTESSNSRFYLTEAFTEFEIENNTLTDLTVNITERIETVPSTIEVMLKESSKNVLNTFNLSDSSTEYLNINTETDITVNLTAEESETTNNSFNSTENYENTLNSFTMGTNPVMTVITATIKENLKHSVNVENVTESMMTEVTVIENLHNILSQFSEATTEEMKTDFIENNSTESSPKNVNNIKLTSNLTESSDISKGLETQNNQELSSSTLQIVTLTSPTTSYDYQLVDVTTVDPRLPFRSIECVGPNNRRQFKASECYQYYQCFAGWAFLLNCHEGWRFEATMGQCVVDTNKECEL